MSTHATRTPPSDEEHLAAYRRALELTNGLIDPAHQLPRTQAALRARASERLARLRRLLTALGDPHRAYPVIHVAGTSGKGSTAVTTAALLQASGLRTGLHVSPYLQVATEKVQVDGRLASGTAFLRATERVLATADAIGIERITYGEAWVALMALLLAEAAVEVAVIEVGAGGRFDLTNVVQPAVAVITSVGFDHMETLGDTIPEIAWHKAGIIKPGAPVVSAVRDPEAIPVIAMEAKTAGVPLIPIVPGETFALRREASSIYAWWEPERLEAVYRPAMAGRFQAINAATALAAVRAFDPALARDPNVIGRGLAAARLQGRFETVQEHPRVILDGAHNPEKCAALVRDLRALRQARPEARLILVAGTLESKDHAAMLGTLLSVADEAVLTTPRVLAKPGADVATMMDDARATGFAGALHGIAQPAEAVAFALGQAGTDDLVVVTGSLYLVGNVRGRWFADDAIVVQRTPWPAPVTEQ